MAESLTIRPAIGTDAADISALIHTLLHHRAPAPTVRPPPEFLAGFSPEVILACLSSTRYRYLVALIGPELVGVLGIRDGEQLLHLFVAGPHQRRGIGRALWSRAKFNLLNASTGPARLRVNSSISALPVYERFGFKACGPAVEGAGLTYVPMEIVISHGH